MSRRRSTVRAVSALCSVAAVLVAWSPVHAGWRRAADRLADALQTEIAWSQTAADVQRGIVELDRERSSLEYSAAILGHASKESMRRLDSYRKIRSQRERTTRARARSLYKLSRGGVARLAFEDLGATESTSADRVRRGLSLRYLVRHDLTELSVHQRAEDRATSELVAAARELQALGALTTVQAMQEHVLVSSEMAVAPELRKVTRRRLRMTDGLEERAVKANRALLRAAKANWKDLRNLQGLKGSARLVRPVKGRIAGRFGEYEDKVLRLAMVRNGVELRCVRNERVRAMADGRVVMTSRLPGFEEVVVIDHGSGQYTLTAHLWEVQVEAGDEIEAGDVLARAAPKAVDDGLGATVYIELRHGEKPVDPTPYLRRASRRD